MHTDSSTAAASKHVEQAQQRPLQVACCTSSHASQCKRLAKPGESRRENSPRRESGTRPLTWWAFRRERRYYSWMRSSAVESQPSARSRAIGQTNCQTRVSVQNSPKEATPALLFTRTSPTTPSRPRHHLCTDHSPRRLPLSPNWTLEANPATLSLGLSGCASKPTHAQQSLDASFGHSSHSSSPVSLTSSADLASDLR